jgi:hypothetical protein
MGARITPVTLGRSEAFSLPALIANENLRLDGWSDHGGWIVFFFGNILQ